MIMDSTTIQGPLDRTTRLIAALGVAQILAWGTFVRGTVPAELFGRDGYGALLGRIATPAFIAKALAPFAFALLLTAGWPLPWLVGFLLVTGIAAIVCYEIARRIPAT